ncbi:MAG: stage II sporulation protein R [Bacillaceae bacterium]|jgi:stage II sporulation protein R|uniref:Stage II sporulation protein R n=1 Tax=Aeribacillus pallidus TaxID=33936 RepID=A0A165WSA7_9BACI|nr:MULTISPECIES: stage II sporulation protein R [Aeribacillus]AXI38533.1 stage II sporulation protein R [Bacillaceae bacterium ZC4]REJ19827.1 MAG: stage II sporulation protein R [Bacillaceae bacterium]ASS89522.1 stage II sporulation protein R [Aeribacillus pallidus]KZN95264.1 stage II sporulation protein R [Aeribacillus pallidus]MDR9796964.1 stage II sporulation protein R [Aeribacillus pallidus]
MKKKLSVIYIFLMLFGSLLTAYEMPTDAKQNETVIIPDEAIRLRILANSDSPEDQALKRNVRNAVNEAINQWVQDLTSIEEARKIIRAKIPEIKDIVQSVLKQENSSQSFTVEFKKIQFPTKLYGNFLYPAGNYEAILITLGEGKGANWWCVLFPPLCFVDFSSGEAIQQDEEKDKVKEEKKLEKTKNLFAPEEHDEEVEVKFFLVEWFTNLFS